MIESIIRVTEHVQFLFVLSIIKMFPSFANAKNHLLLDSPIGMDNFPSFTRPFEKCFPKASIKVRRGK